ncbi:MAG: hypothetical protein A2X34_05405 [Elusimicrobia bacterium GWC2_51_8]|nr:MAG: hypothetical protein A2X33_00805 [Elusimicrobia bacterium GWA2_51_34]OGR59177.1 MAG: hypothetical protein A2X34_05405 [Elusimicrobia bacterium GWC2_51_8]OGR84501.1 MAG: hypothetical protein A2021_03085 [Elusimicrobia bacterium GWF2_52_66]HAF94795.1 hypothetical protein [Elusimicrobiota bacterium]HCE98895.1 hypothetical protein [Elusimicrobiota bacterium]
MKIKKHLRFIWWLVFSAITIHVVMIGRALLIMGNLQSINSRFSAEYVKLIRVLELTNGVRRAEESIRHCAFYPSSANRVAYCEALQEADEAASAAASAGVFSAEFTGSDIDSLRASLANNIRRCTAPPPSLQDKKAAQEEFARFYDTASGLRKKLSAHARSRLEANNRLSETAEGKTTELIISTSAIATFILLLMFWAAYYRRRLNRDITEQRDKILVLKSGIEQSSLGVILTNTSGTIEYVNPAFTTMYGYSPAEVTGKNPRLLKSGETPLPVYHSLWKMLLGGHPWTGELHNKTKSGGLLWVKATISPVCNSEGRLTNFMALHKDVTLERQLMAVVVEAKREAERANQAKSDFLAAMSHEIRTPLNAIVGMSELIDEAGLNKEQAQYLSIMRTASDTLISLINNILDISKIEAGKVEIEKAPFNLEELVSEVSEMMSVRAFRKYVDLNCRIEADVPVFVEGDSTRLRQVLMNLTGNAVKFVEKGYVSLHVKKLKADGDFLQLLFSVRDTGIGIPADKLETIFEKFTQADSSTTRKYGGTGLGLPIAKMLVKLMGGKIWAESEPGVGTVFYFTVNLCSNKDKKTLYLPKADIKELKGQRLLVVDENAVNRSIIREIVQSCGASCEGSADGETGLAKILKEQHKGEPFHGVFVDFNIPDMAGYEFCRRLMADASISPKPALALVTSDIVRFKRDDFHAIGVNTHILKPVKKQTVLDGALEMLTAGKAVPSSLARASEGRGPAKLLLSEAVTLACRGPMALSTTDPSAAPQKAAEYAKEELPALSALLVDDSEDNRILISSFLKGSKVKLELATDGFDALEKFRTAAYDIIFMDMQMPKMDGFETAGKLRVLETAENRVRTRVVALTAMATREDEDKALKAGCDDYLTKPIRKNTFYTYLVDFAAGRSKACRLQSPRKQSVIRP